MRKRKTSFRARLLCIRKRKIIGRRDRFRVFQSQANEIIEAKRADIVLLAREFIRNPNFVLTAASELGIAVKPANQYERAWTRVLRPRGSDDAAQELNKKQSKSDSA